MPHTLRRVTGVVGVGLLLIVLSACRSDGDRDSANHTTQVAAGETLEHQSDSGGESEGHEAEFTEPVDGAADRTESDTGSKDEGEESGTQYGPGDTYDDVRNGARLIMTYDPVGKVFTGTVENTTNKVLSQVRVEVHLSNGVELGPTTPTDLPAGQVLEVSLDATGVSFDSWNAHPEVGEGAASGEHAGETGEHDSAESGEHDSTESGEHGG